MPAPIKIRASYSSDSNYLLRLKRAVEIDDRLSVEMRTECIETIDMLVVKLMRADSEVRQAAIGAPSSPSKKKRA